MPSRNKLTILFAVGNLVFVYLVYALLRFGTLAQRTYNYSVLKEFESAGLLATNAYQVIQSRPGMSLQNLNPIKTSHGLVVATCVVWAVASTWLMLVATKKTDVPSPPSEP